MKPLSKYIYLIVIFLISGGYAVVYGQNKSKLEKEKAALLSEINQAQQILAQTSTKKKSSVGQLKAINKEIDGRQKLIATYAHELKALNAKIGEDEIVISALQQDLDNLKREYADMVFSAYKASNGFNLLSYIFSSASLDQFYMRFKYLEQYTSSRKNQVKLIEEIKSDISGDILAMEHSKKEKKKLLDEQLIEKEKLDKLKKDQARVLANLKKEEKRLAQNINKQKQEVQKLENLISRLLKEELAKKSAPKSTVAGKKIDLDNISSLFEKSKAHLSWPVTTGFISEKFGTHPHPVLTRVKMPNDGVNIQTKKDESVRAVFDGIVKKIAIVPGEFKYVVIIQHGSYFTVYAKLKKVKVKMGEKVAKNDIVGEVNTDVDGISEVQFQVWKNTQKLDPEQWLVKR